MYRVISVWASILGAFISLAYSMHQHIILSFIEFLTILQQRHHQHRTKQQNGLHEIKLVMRWMLINWARDNRRMLEG